MVPAQLPVRDLKEFVALAKAEPGKHNFGHPGVGLTPYLSMEHFKRSTGVQLQGKELSYTNLLDLDAAARIVLEFPSVGATENLLAAAVLAEGTTVIENAAREPEISDLAAFLNAMGARVAGAGTSTITIEGVSELRSVDTELCGDRIEAGTYLTACGVAGGEIELDGIRLDQLEMVVVKLRQMGMVIEPTATGLRARARHRLHAVDVATLPFPGFATDFMPMTVALLSVSDGTKWNVEVPFSCSSKSFPVKK